MKRILHLMRKEFIQTFRDRRMVAIIFIAPTIQLILFGFAVTLDVEHAAFAVWNRDPSPESREIVRMFEQIEQFENVGTISDKDQVETFFRRGEGDFVIVIEPGFAEDLRNGTTADVQILFDGSDANYAGRLGSVADAAIGRFNQDHLGKVAASIAARSGVPMTGFSAQPIEPSVRVWYNPDLESEVFMVPAVVAVLLLVVTMLLTTMAITREKEVGTLEHIIVTPIKPYQLILGKMAPFILIGFIDVTLIVLAAWVVFAIPIRGSLGLLYFASLVYLFTTLGMGLLFSTVSKTQQQAMFLTFMFIMPAVLLSGFIFPIENMPHALQLFTYANPLRYFLVIVRGIFLKGTGIAILWEQFAALAVLGGAIFALAVSRFGKTLE